jgi:hypothetical protein
LAKVVPNSFNKALLLFKGNSAVEIDFAKLAKAYSPSLPKICS